MTRLLQPLLLYLSAATDRQLARQNQFLKTENNILRSKLPKRLVVTPQERQRLIKFGKGLGPALKHLISIVSVRTFNRWLSAAKDPPSKDKGARKPGRPPKPIDIRQLVRRIAGETGWGATRIHGELEKLGVRDISRSTVANILRENGFDPGPLRGEGTWSDFIKRHAETLWACDFFTKKVWTMRGLVDIYVLFFIHVCTRRVHIAGMTANPDNAWMVLQARNQSIIFAEQAVPPKYLIMDRDTNLTAGFREVLESDGVSCYALVREHPI